MKNLFDGNYLSKYLDSQKDLIRAKFKNFPEAEIEHLDHQAIIDRNLPEFEIEEISIEFESRKVNLQMIGLTKDRFPPQAQFSMEDGKKYDCAKVTYTYKIKGRENIFNFKPDTFHSQINISCEVSNKQLEVIIQTYYGNENLNDKTKTEIKGIMQRFEDDVKRNLDNINKQIKEYNSSLPKLMEDLLQIKKNISKSRKNAESDLNDF